MTVLALLLTLLATAPDAGIHPLRRFLLATAAEYGGPEKVRLRYSLSDARGVAAVMSSLGGISPSRAVLLQDPDTGRFLSEFQALSRRMELAKDSGYRVELMVYYSGHSDEDGLLLGRSHLSYARLRQTLDAAPAEVRLAVLDACASGAALRAKGGQRRQAFHIEGAERLRGQAFLTSSRAEEASQESDRIGGSFFTQAFLTGLMGAADADADGRVTLLEAYRYAYDETVASTASTRAGPQHPEFDIDLSGSGDVVLTDLHQAGAMLQIPDEMSGRLVITDSAGEVVAQLRKLPGRPLALGLAAGAYRIQTLGDSTRRTSHMRLAAGTRTLLAVSETDSVTPLATPAAPDISPAPVAPDSVPRFLPVNVGIFTPWSVNGTQAARACNILSLDLLQGEAGQINGIQIAPFLAKAEHLDGLQISLGSRAGEIRGLQIGGLAASASQKGYGSQIASLVAWNGGDFTGFQTSVVSLASSNFVGFQSSATLAWSSGDFTGLQASVAALSAGNVTGVQAGVVEWCGGDLAGLQMGVANRATAVAGTQISVLNVGGSVRGTQMGVINLASSVKGSQIGVINLAGLSKGVSLGVVTLAKDLEALPVGLIGAGANMTPSLEAWAEPSSMGTLALRLDGKRFHTKIAAVTALTEPQRRLGYGFGCGAHWVPAVDWKINGDLLARQIWRLPEQGAIQEANWNSASLDLHRSFGPFSLFAGASWNVLVADGSAQNFVRIPGGIHSDPSASVRMWPSVFMGAGIVL